MLYIRKKREINPVDYERDNYERVFPFFVESLSSQRIYIFENDMTTVTMIMTTTMTTMTTTMKLDAFGLS